MGNSSEQKRKKHDAYLKNKEKILEANKLYRDTHKEEIKERNRKYREKHREEILERNREYSKKYYTEHIEERKDYQQNHREENKERSKKWREIHKEEAQERAKQWRIENPEEYLRTHQKIHRAKRLLAFELISEHNELPLECHHCGERRIWLLTIGHMNDDGVKERKENGEHTHDSILKNIKSPGDLRVECVSCNLCKAWYVS